MKIDVRILREGSTNFDFVLVRSDCTRMDKDIQFGSQGIACSGELVNLDEKIKLDGAYRGTISKACDRCMKELEVKFAGEFCLILLPENARQQEQEIEVEIDAQAMDIEYYSAGIIELNQIFEDQFILDFPLNMVCSEDCKGLCSECGVNLNTTTCDCDSLSDSNPFSCLKELKP